MGDEQIECSVSIEVGPAGAAAPKGVVESGSGGGDFVIRAVPAIVEQGQAAVTGDEQVGKAIGIEVAGGDAVVVAAGDRQPGQVREIAKREFAPVLKQRGRVGGRAEVGGELPASREVEVIQAIEIEVDLGGTPAERLEDREMPRLLSVTVGEIDLGCGRRVAKSNEGLSGFGLGPFPGGIARVGRFGRIAGTGVGSGRGGRGRF
jgi:hypothetical protein